MYNMEILYNLICASVIVIKFYLITFSIIGLPYCQYISVYHSFIIHYKYVINYCSIHGYIIILL